MKAAIIGTTGYGGNELLRLLLNHPVFKVQSIHSTSETQQINEIYPHFSKVYENNLENVDVEKICKNNDLVFFSTPTGVTSNLLKQFQQYNIKLVDLSGDLRLKNRENFEQWYKKEAADQQLIDQATYGLTEWNYDEIQKASLIANPGCYPTAVLLGIAPLITNKLIDLNSVIIDAKSGVTGAGRSPARITNFAEITDNLNVYKVNEHQHTPEIEQQLKIWDKNSKPITFSTHLVPIGRGIMATMYGQLNSNTHTERLIELYKSVYENHPFIRIRSAGQFPAVKEVRGSNYCDVGITVDERTNRVTVVSVIDNLMKGAAGQAIQNANLMFGLKETAGLEILPLYP